MSTKRHFKVCEFCNADFKSRRSDTKFCSTQCSLYHHRSKRVVRRCMECQKVYFSEFVKRNNPMVFCSIACASRYQQRPKRTDQQRSCFQCGKVIRGTNHRFRGKMNFCTPKCQGEWRSKNLVGPANPNYKGHVRRRGYGWGKLAAEVKNERGHKCEICGNTTRRLHVHHRLPYRIFRTMEEANDKSNLMVVCCKCHPTEDARFCRDFPLFKAVVSLRDVH